MWYRLYTDIQYILTFFQVSHCIYPLFDMFSRLSFSTSRKTIFATVLFRNPVVYVFETKLHQYRHIILSHVFGFPNLHLCSTRCLVSAVSQSIVTLLSFSTNKTEKHLPSWPVSLHQP